MLIIAIIVGVLLGGAWDHGPFGAAVGGLLAWLLVQGRRQDAAIAELRRVLAGAQRRTTPPGAEPGSARAAAVSEPVLEPMPEPTPQAPRSAAMSSPMPLPARDAAAATPPASSSAPPTVPAATTPAPREEIEPSSTTWATEAVSQRQARAAPTPAPQRDWLAPAKAWLFGGNTIVKLGVAILFIGLAFLAKLASEHVQVPIELRLAIIGAAAIGLLGFGWRLRQRRAAYAQALQGAAVAVLFLTLFVAFRTFHVLPAFAVFLLMVAVAALAAALAVLQDAKALAVIGALGAFATPLLVSTGGGNPVALFAYYLALDLGIAGVAWFKHWRALNLIGFVATFGVATAWGVFDYRAERYPESQAFLIAFFLLFGAIALLPARRLAPTPGASDAPGTDASGASGERSAAWVNGSLLFGLPTITFALQLGMVRHMPFGSALSALVLAACYVLLALWARRRAEFALVFEASLAIGAVFLTLVIPFALDARSTAGAWALEGAGLVWLGFRQARRLARMLGYGLLLLAGPTFVWALERHGAPQAIFNAYLFNALMAVAGSLLAAFVVRRGAAAGRAMRGEAMAEPALVGWATLWALGITALQIDQFVQPPYGLAVWLVAGSVIALGATALAVRWDWPTLAWPTLGHALLLALAALDGLLALRPPWAEGGAWAWPVALATHLVVLRWAAVHWGSPEYLRAETLRSSPWERPGGSWPQQVVHALGVLVLATLGALGGRALTAGWGDAHSAWAWLGWLVAPALILTALLRPVLAQCWPVAAAPRAYALWAGGTLAAALWGWTLLANVLSNGAARPLPHVPLLNPLDLGVGFALIGTWMWLQSAAVGELLAKRRWFVPAVMGLAGFVWLNAMLIRAFHHYGAVPYRLQAWVHSLPVHTGITLLWTGTALALMWLAARRALRAPWVVGACLLAAVVVKLVLVDLSGSGTVTRIVSFIGVGLLMLVIGYVAPLPAREDSDVKA